MKNIFSKLLLILGLSFLIFAIYLFYLRYSSHPLAFEAKPQNARNAKTKDIPINILIPSISADLPVIPATINAKTWGTTTKGVNYLTSSPLPGEKGNSVMYGHNWTSILKNLPKIKPGQKIIVSMQDGKKKEFKVEYTATVTPDQKSTIENTNDTRLTIYTCTGFLDSKRFVVVAKPAILTSIVKIQYLDTASF